MALRSISAFPDFTFSAGACDVRGWTVRTLLDGEAAGTVDDVLVDADGTARYLDVDLADLDRHVLLPIGQARVDGCDDVVWVPGMIRERFASVPAYGLDCTSIDGAFETCVSDAYYAALSGDRYYDRPEYIPAWGGERVMEPASADVGTTRARLRPLSELHDYEVADGDPDPRGWEVVAADHRRIGAVEELIVDAPAMKVRYLDIELDEKELGPEPHDRRILLPVGYARLERDDGRVVLDAFRAADLAAIPGYSGDIDREYEETLHARYTRGFTGENLYRHPRFREDSFYGPRREVC